MKTLLLAIANDEYRKELHYIFKADGYNIIMANTIEKVLKIDESADIIISESNYSDGSGMDLIEKIREKSDIPLIMVTDEDEDLQKILALEYGADDYMAKPFNILELKARIRSLLKRKKLELAIEEQLIIETDGLTLHIIGRLVEYENIKIELTGKEFDILLVLSLNNDKVISREKLSEMIWGNDFKGDERAIDVHIKRIREKMTAAGASTSPIETKWGEGYFVRKKI